MSKQRAASPRFRTDDPTPIIALQPDDLKILWHVYCNRVLDAKSLYSLFPNRSAQVISRRLNLLRKGSDPYLQRLAVPSNRVRLRTGSEPMVYAIANRGAAAIKHHYGLDLRVTRWRAKNDALKVNTIQHELAISRFMVRAWRDAEQGSEDLKLIYQPELMAKLMPERQQSRGLSNTLRTRIINWPGNPGEQGTAPDQIFGYEAGGRIHYIFLEIDEGTETIVPGKSRLHLPSFWRDTSLLRKFVIYASAFETKAHADAFNIPVFRVLTVTKSADRVASMQAAILQFLPRARAGLFLFTDWQALSNENQNLFSFSFYDTRRHEVFLRRR